MEISGSLPFDEDTLENPDTGKLNEFAPELPGRMMVLGCSGSGKTKMICNVLQKYWTFHYLFVHAKFIEKKDYKGLKKYFENQEEKLGEQRASWSDTLDDLPDVKDLDEDIRTIILIDDMMSEDAKQQKKISNLYIAGRKGGASVITLVQSLIGLAKNGRRNLTDLFLFGGSSPIDRDSLIYIWKNYCNDLTQQEFLELYNSCIQIPYGFLYIDLRAPTVFQKYRYKFDCFLNPIILKKKFQK